MRMRIGWMAGVNVGFLRKCVGIAGLGTGVGMFANGCRDEGDCEGGSGAGGGILGEEITFRGGVDSDNGEVGTEEEGEFDEPLPTWYFCKLGG